MQIRPVVRTTQGIQTSDGAGVRLRRLMGGGAGLPSIDPFLMLDFFDSPNARTTSPAFRRIRIAASRRSPTCSNGRMRHVTITAARA